MKTAVRAGGDVSFQGLGNCAADTLALAQSGHEFGPGEETRSSSQAGARRTDPPTRPLTSERGSDKVSV
jgi:hypothetical protein